MVQAFVFHGIFVASHTCTVKHFASKYKWQSRSKIYSTRVRRNESLIDIQQFVT